MDTQIRQLSAEQFRNHLPEALSVYVAAMGYSPHIIRSRAPAWSEHSRRPEWSAVAAFNTPHRRLSGYRTSLVGICYGYRGQPGQWWYDQVDRGLRSQGRSLQECGNYVELTELHVLPQYQGVGLGRSLLSSFLATRTEPKVMLSTPECRLERNSAWHLYRAVGFQDVLRNFRFHGDPRPFGVLSRSLPLTKTLNSEPAQPTRTNQT